MIGHPTERDFPTSRFKNAYNAFVTIASDDDVLTALSSDLQPQPGRRMTEEEFWDWLNEKTWAEWVDGEVIVLSPISLRHADIAAFLLRLISQFVEETDAGKVLNEPFHIRSAKRRIRSPDVFFVSKSRLSLFENYFFQGPPDLIVEVISPTSGKRDRKEKFAEYEADGVREYWLADPRRKIFEVYSLDSAGQFQLIPPRDGLVYSVVLPKLFIDPAWLWCDSSPRILPLIQQMLSAT